MKLSYKIKEKGGAGDEFNIQIRRLLIPIVLQNILSAAVSSADVLMLNYVGQSSISAVSLATQYANVLFMVYSGLGSGAAILCAQYFGKGDMRAIDVIKGIAMRFSLLFSIIFAGLAAFAPGLMMKLFTDDTELIALGSSYLRIISISYLCWGIIEVYLAILRSIGRVVVCTVLNTMTFSLNILLNAVFIFGLFGAPKLGVIGVAAATSFSRVLELTGCILVSFFSQDVKLRPADLFLRNPLLFKDFMKISLPALGNNIVWSVAFSMYSVIIGHLGSDAVAANSFASVVRSFGTILCHGIASAGGILLGKILGENRLEEALTVSKRLIKMSVFGGLFGGVVILAATPLALQFADLTDTAMHYLKNMLLINTYYVMGTALNTTFIACIFRAGGDSRFGFICDIFDMWCYAVPLGFLAAFVLKLPVMWVYFLLCTDEFVKWPWIIKHYRSKKWLHNITRDDLFVKEGGGEHEM
ncbi:MAG: MATE family efflux transporter [Roseburia sp.]|nr:MATE family efflux transporter [Roseburia sp.]